MIFLRGNFGSDSTIDSQVTVRYGSPAQDDDSG